jgi:hypothetical protein
MTKKEPVNYKFAEVVEFCPDMEHEREAVVICWLPEMYSCLIGDKYGRVSVVHQMFLRKKK